MPEKKPEPLPARLVMLETVDGVAKGAVVASSDLPDAAAHIAAGRARPALPLDIAIAGLAPSHDPQP